MFRAFSDIRVSESGGRRMGLDQRLQLMEMELQNLRQRNGGYKGVLADGLW